MRCLSKKILCYILIGFLTFSVTSTVYYKSVHAMEWVGGALAFEEALKWLLAAIGITATAGMTDAYWDAYGDDFTDYAIENGATQTEVAEWQLKACQGIIDKGSDVWTKFKAWASNLVSGGSSADGSFLGSPQSVITDVNNRFNTSFSIDSSFMTNNILASCVVQRWSGSTFFTYVYLFHGGIPTVNASGNLNYESFSYYYASFNATTNSASRFQSSTGYISLLRTEAFITSNIVNNSNLNIGVLGGSVSDSNFESSISNVNDLDVISSDGVDEDNPEVTTPMPGVSDSDNEISKDAYQDIIDAINDGTITQDQGVAQIQEILKIVTYDTVTDKVVPPQQNEDGTDKTKDDVLKENKENMGFTLGGLEAVFPFCIPFDIYAFMTLLVAEPECPEFDFPIKSVNGQVEEIHVDLEPFEPVAVVVRYVFDFLFIIGLAMLTRSLIGGGSSD